MHNRYQKIQFQITSFYATLVFFITFPVLLANSKPMKICVYKILIVMILNLHFVFLLHV